MRKHLQTWILSLVASTAFAYGDASAQQASTQALVERAVANQHRNDAALAEYERLEHRQARKDGKVVEDKTYRVAPTGTGTLRLTVEENGRPAAPELYRKQLRDLEQGLAWALDPQESRQKQRVEKFNRRNKERYDLVEAMKDAFMATRVGEETRNGRTVVKLQLAPNPAFKPKSRTAEMLTSSRVTLWVDEAAGQVVRAEAEVFRDISFGGGILGKIYKGSRFVIEQSEAAPGLWLPTLIQSDYTGRKFIFGFEAHETTEARNYRRLGPPREALAAIRRELNSPAAPPTSR